MNHFALIKMNVVILLFLLIMSPLGQALNLFSQTNTLDGRSGGIIAFTSNKNGRSEIYLMNASGSNLTNITNNEQKINN